MTSTPDLSLAPGCHGWALAFNPETVCQSCPFAASCERAADAALAALQAEIGLSGLKLPPSRAKRKAEIAAQGLMPVLPAKVQALADGIEKKGLKVAESLKRGDNPFTKPAFLRVAAHLLLKLPQGIDRKTLSMALQHKLGWSAGTASAHASQVFALLPALGAATEMNGRLRIER